MGRVAEVDLVRVHALPACAQPPGQIAAHAGRGQLGEGDPGHGRQAQGAGIQAFT